MDVRRQTILCRQNTLWYRRSTVINGRISQTLPVFLSVRCEISVMVVRAREHSVIYQEILHRRMIVFVALSFPQ